MNHNTEEEARKDWFRGINCFSDVVEIIGSKEKAKEILTDETAKKLFHRYGGADPSGKKWANYKKSIMKI